jgi:hypothetical protein
MSDDFFEITKTTGFTTGPVAPSIGHNQPNKVDVAIASSMAGDINRAYDAAMADARSAVGHAVECGRLLDSTKEIISKAGGSWSAWLRENTHVPERADRQWRRIAKHADLVIETMNDDGALTFADINRLIAEHSNPEKAIGDLQVERMLGTDGSAAVDAVLESDNPHGAATVAAPVGAPHLDINFPKEEARHVRYQLAKFLNLDHFWEVWSEKEKNKDLIISGRVCLRVSNSDCSALEPKRRRDAIITLLNDFYEVVCTRFVSNAEAKAGRPYLALWVSGRKTPPEPLPEYDTAAFERPIVQTDVEMKEPEAVKSLPAGVPHKKEAIPSEPVKMGDRKMASLLKRITAYIITQHYIGADFILDREIIEWIRNETEDSEIDMQDIIRELAEIVTAIKKIAVYLSRPVRAVAHQSAS